MKKKYTLLPFMALFTAFILFSCETTETKPSDEGDYCLGYEYDYDDYTADSINLPAFMNRDSVDNGYRVFTVELDFSKPACYEDSIFISPIVQLEMNQQHPVTVKSHLVADFVTTEGKAAEYSVDVPIRFDGEYWMTNAANNHWAVLPKPHVDGTHIGICYLYVDFVFPTTGNESNDWMYFRSIFQYMGITRHYRRSKI